MITLHHIQIHNMKNILTAALFTTITTAAFAQNQGNSAVRVQFTDNSPVAVSIDGRYYDDRSSSVLADNLSSGSHTMIIYRGGRSSQQGRSAVVKEMTLRLEPNVTTTYSVGPDGYTTTSREPYPANNNDRGYDNRNGNNNGGYGNNDDRYGDRNDNRGGNYRDNRNQSSQYDDRDDRYNGNNRPNNNQNTPDDNRYDRRGDRRGGGYGRGYHRRHEGRYNDRNNEPDMPEYVMLETTDITSIKAKAQKKIKDADKLTVIKNEIGDRGFTTEQARTMLRWMKGETARLDFAKWAYQNVSDIENFSKLNTEFKLAKSKTELNNLSSGDY